jgi:hypothetical protein
VLPRMPFNIIGISSVRWRQSALWRVRRKPADQLASHREGYHDPLQHPDRPIADSAREVTEISPAARRHLRASIAAETVWTYSW